MAWLLTAVMGTSTAYASSQDTAASMSTMSTSQANFVQNASFEDKLEGWTLDKANTPHATYLTEDSRTGKYALTCWSMEPYVSHVYQSIQKVKPGYYSLTAYTQSSGGQDCAYLYAYGSGQGKCMTSLPTSGKRNEDNIGWNLVTVRGIEVGKDGLLTIGFYSKAQGRQFVNLDDITLVPESSPPDPFLIGGDIAQLTYVEDCGARFYDEDGKQADALQILAEKGWNFARIRLYNDPGKGHGNGTHYCPPDYLNQADTLQLAKRIQQKGMATELTFHYSDYWTNAETQIIPYEWQKQIEGLSESAAVAKLETLIYTFTRDFMQKMVEQGTIPEYVSIGNEIQNGMLYPYGKASVEGWPNLARFFNAGYQAVKDISPNSQVVLHLDGCGDVDKYTQFFDALQSHGGQFDIVGASYYPFFAQCTVNQVTDFCNTITQRYNCDILLMETGFNWNATIPGGWPGQLETNGPYEGVYAGTPAGQREFLIDLFNALQNVEGGRCIGNLYWDPIFVEQEGVGWAYNEEGDTVADNIVSNTTLFDFDHNALPTLDAYTYNGRGAKTAFLAGRLVGNDQQTFIESVPVEVTLDGQTYQTVTDACGGFFLAVPDAKNASLSLRAKGLALVSGDQTVRLNKGDILKQTFTLDGGTISGSVIDEQGKPVPNAYITVSGEGHTYSLTSAADGTYIAADRPAGTYTVSAQAEGYAINTEPFSVSVGIGETQKDHVIQTTLTSGTLTGVVQDQNGKPLPDASVSAWAVDSPNSTYQTVKATTDENGRYKLPFIPAGVPYRVQADKATYNGTPTDVSVGRGEVKTLPTLSLIQYLGSMTGRVVDTNGNGIANTVIEIRSPEGYYYTANTDATGAFHLDSVLAATYQLCATGEGQMEINAADLVVKQDAATNVGTLTVPQPVAIENPGFEIAGATYEKARGWQIECTGSSTACVRQNRAPFGGAPEGEFALSLWLDKNFTADVSQKVTDLPPGRYVLRVKNSSWITNRFTMYAKDENGAILAQQDIPASASVTTTSLEFETTDSSVTIGFQADAAGGDWAVLDCVELGRY